MAQAVMFSEWLNEKMRGKKLTQAELARLAGIDPGTVYKLLNAKTRRPTPETCKGLARALEVSPETVYRAAGIQLPETSFPESEDLNYIVVQLPSVERQKVLAMARVLLDFAQKGPDRTR
jgi:transcriptional regulator with XRE-family HTH domain